jgi:hypothetical protein
VAAKTCPLDSHPLIEDINDLLKSPSGTYGTIRTYLIEHNESPIERYALSRHSLGCLGLSPRARGRPRKNPIEIGEDVPPLQDVRDLAIRVLYSKLQNSPDEVKARDLIPFIVQAMKAEEGADKRGEADDILAQLGKIKERSAPRVQ